MLAEVRASACKVHVQVDAGGTIDPFMFVDEDGSKWLLSKNDGNAVGQPTFIHICALTPDGLQVITLNPKP